MALMDELNQQPEALLRLVDFYRQNPELLNLRGHFPNRRSLLTGMGASFHAARIASYCMNQQGVPCTAQEASDLLNYGMPALEPDILLVYISQSGSSGEVPALLERLNPDIPLVSITNKPDSPLASGSKMNLPMLAGEENWIASKTYLNSLAILWLLARRMAGGLDGSEFAALLNVAERISMQLQGARSTGERLVSTFEDSQPLIFLGYGPHAVTARQAAMLLGEWAKLPVLHYSAGAFRHGYIEIVEPGCGVVMFAPPQPESSPAYTLARDLQKYAAHLLLVENGLLRQPDEPAVKGEPLDEFLSPMVDIVPFQVYAEALAPRRGFGKGFRYISKIVTQL